MCLLFQGYLFMCRYTKLVLIRESFQQSYIHEVVVKLGSQGWLLLKTKC